MRLGNKHFVLSVVTAFVLMASPRGVYAQGGSMGLPSNIGSLALAPGQLMGGGQSKSQDPIIYVNDSFVSIIDSAVPRNLFMMRFDGNYNIRQPMRGEFLTTKGGFPNTNGFPLIETRLDYMDWTTHAEYAMTPWFSMFMDAPYRWLNPEVNSNQSGSGDLKWGFKLCTWTSERLIATILCQVYQPTASRATLGTEHWSIEPGLLAAFRYNENILLEGEVRYWAPIGGTDFAGDMIRYGFGLSFGQRKSSGVWYMPVLEGVGWTMLSGKTISATTPENYLVLDARGQTILNAYLGIRFGTSDKLDFYAGYGRSFTSEAWQREFFRIEMRYIY